LEDSVKRSLIILYLLSFPSLAVSQPSPVSKELSEGAFGAVSEGISGAEQITVQGESFGTIAPDTVEIRLLVEGNGASAQAASASATKKQTALSEALNKLALNELKISSEGEKYLGPNNSETITANQPVSVRKMIQIEMGALDKTALVIDESLKSGASAVTEVSFQVRKESPAKLALISEATLRSKQKAEAVARAAGVKLGFLLSVVLSEEPEMKLVRMREQRGESEEMPGAKDFKVTALASFSLEGAP
jgi:hypothetical protein